MYGPPWGCWPQAPMMYAPQQPYKPSLEDVLEAKKRLKELEKELKDEGDKKKDSTPKGLKKTFTFLETMGLLMFFGPIVGYTYLNFILLPILSNMNVILNAPH